MEYELDTIGTKYLAKAVIHRAIKDIEGRFESASYEREDKKQLRRDAFLWVRDKLGTFDLWCLLFNESPSRMKRLIWGKCHIE